MMRSAFAEVFDKDGNKQLVKDLTVGDAIQAQKEWVIKQKQEYLAANELKAKVEKQKKELSVKLKSMINLAATSKRNLEGDFEKYVVIEMNLENEGDKDIECVKGKIIFNDIFGDKILASGFSYDNGIQAKSI